MLRILTPVWIVLCAALFTSCAEDALINYDNIRPHLVIQGRLSPDTSFSISITSSLTPTDTSAYAIPEGLNPSLIDLNTNGVINLYLENGRFVAPLQYPKVGHHYKIYAVAPGFTTAEATTSIPDPAELDNGVIENLRLVTSPVTNEKQNVSYNLKVTFKPNTERYFHLSFIQKTTINYGTISQPDYRDFAYFIDPQFPGNSGFYQHHETGVLVDTDKIQNSSLTFSFIDYTLGDLEELGKLIIEVRTVTPEYYLYYTSLSRQLISRDDPFAEPIPVYNNVRDGSGNFSGYSSKLYTITIIP